MIVKEHLKHLPFVRDSINLVQHRLETHLGKVLNDFENNIIDNQTEDVFTNLTVFYNSSPLKQMASRIDLHTYYTLNKPNIEVSIYYLIHFKETKYKEMLGKITIFTGGKSKEEWIK